MSAGPVIVSDSRFALPPKRDVYNSIEGLMNHFKIVIEGIKLPAGEIYLAVEGANGELGFYLVSDGSGRPYRVRVRPPCFFGMAALGDDAQGPHDRGHHHHLRHDQHDRRRVRPLRKGETGSDNFSGWPPMNPTGVEAKKLSALVSPWRRRTKTEDR